MAGDRQSYDLTAVRADDWFLKVADSAPNFGQLCDAIGERFVAFALVAGIRITALAIDGRSPDQTMVTFCIGEEGEAEEHQMQLPEFRRCLTQALTQPDTPAGKLPDDMGDVEAVQAYLGVRYVLLAAVFEIVPLALFVGGGASPTLQVGLGGLSDEVGIEEFREVIREAVRREERSAERQRPFSIDLGKVPEAADALAAGEFGRVVEILEPWTGPLSMLLRTPQGQNLGAEAKGALGRALGLLGSAYIERGDYTSAEEVLRLGVQWMQDGVVAGQLFCELGRLALKQQHPGQAIGLFRRAMSLGASRAKVLAWLAQCFLARDRAVAALVCAQEAQEAGAATDDLAQVRKRALSKVGSEYEALRRHLAS